MVDRFLSRTGFFIAIFFTIIFLTFMNSKSLNYMFQGWGQIDGYFSLIGGITFSMFTIIIMRMSKRKWLSYTFPMLDTFLVFCGFNLPYAGHLFDNPIRFGLSILLAIFCGLITFTIGQVNADKHDGSKNESESNQIESNRIISELEAKLNESNRIIEDLKSNQIESKRINDDLKQIIAELLPGHIQWENFLGQKRKERNGYEAKMEDLSRRVKSGEKITYEHFKREVQDAKN